MNNLFIKPIKTEHNYNRSTEGDIMKNLLNFEKSPKAISCQGLKNDNNTTK
jgi:hypothetical protein